MSSAPRFPRPGRVVVKVGSSSLHHASGGLDRDFVADLAAQIVDVCAHGTEVVLVSSGAVAAGLHPLGLSRRPSDLPALQAAASVGQGILVHTYQTSFAAHGMICGQVLLTPDDVVQRSRYLNARQTFEKLLELGTVPIVNENDAVATEELRFGDNDRLAALAASMLGAELLVLLSDVDGLLADDPSRVAAPAVIDRVDELTDVHARVADLPGSAVGSGGMASKLEAVRIATFSAAHAVIANARRSGVIADAVTGAHVGTWFPPSKRRPESRKLWIAFATAPQGSVTIDEGAVRALVNGGKSLLAAGVIRAAGDFAAGDPVDVTGPDERVVARGLIAYGRADVERLRGRSSAAVTADLGDAYARELIHRDRLVIVA